MFTGWNPTWKEATETIYEFTILGAARAQMTLKLFPWSKLRTVWIRKFPLENEDFAIYWYLQVADHCWWEFKTAAKRMDFSDLNEIIL